MAHLLLKEVPIQFLPIGTARVQVTVLLPVGTEVLALFQDARLGPKVLTRQDIDKPTEERTFIALQVGPDLIPSDRQATYIGSFLGYYRTIASPPPEGEPAPPPVLKQEVYHFFEIPTPSKPQQLPAPTPESKRLMPEEP